MNTGPTTVSLADVTDINASNLNFSNSHPPVFEFALSPDARYIAIRSTFELRVIETTTSAVVFQTTIDDITEQQDYNNDERRREQTTIEFTDNGKYLIIGAGYRWLTGMTASDIIDVASWKKIRRILPLEYWHTTSDGAYLYGFCPIYSYNVVRYSLNNTLDSGLAVQGEFPRLGEYGFINNSMFYLLRNSDDVYAFDMWNPTAFHSINFPALTDSDKVYRWAYEYYYDNNRTIIAQLRKTPGPSPRNNLFTFVNAESNSIISTTIMRGSLSQRQTAFHERGLFAAQPRFTDSITTLFIDNLYTHTRQIPESPSADSVLYEALAFSADGKYLAGSYYDNGWNVRIWKLKV